MFHKDYSNFVRPVNDEICNPTINFPKISGDEAKKLYLEEVQNTNNHCYVSNSKLKEKTNKCDRSKHSVNLSDKELFLCVQNNNTELVSKALDAAPEKIDITDEYGWNLLMIACQANSVETVKELLKRGIDTSIRDKAGNSAHSLVIKNRNLTLADILLSHKPNVDSNKSQNVYHKNKCKIREEYKCEICGNNTYPDKEEHLSSTVHNINASKGKKIPTNYVIPQSNKGFQLMLKGGWDKESGLGPDGTGNKYPIKPVLKKDRKGLGLQPKNESTPIRESNKIINRKMLAKERHNSRRMEINFRRQFYDF